MVVTTSLIPITMDQATKQQEAIKKIMADQKVPFEQAANIYIKTKRD